MQREVMASYYTYTSLQKALQKDKIIFVLSQFLTEGEVHLMTLGLLMCTPYFKLIQWVKYSAAPLTLKYQFVLGHLLSLYGDAFFGHLNDVLEFMGNGTAFQNYVSHNIVLASCFAGQRKEPVPASLENKYLLLLLGLKICEKGQGKMGFEYFLKDQMHEKQEMTFEVCSVCDLFEIVSKGYEKFPQDIFLEKLQETVDMVGMDNAFVQEFVHEHLPLMVHLP